MAQPVLPTRTNDASRSSPGLASSNTAAGLKRKRTTERKFYAVRHGKKPGIYETWQECLDQVRGHKGAVFKAFQSLHEAQAFMEGKVLANTTPGEQKYYGVQNGRVPGVYTDWTQAQAQIRGIRKPKHKKFNTRAEAEAYVAAGKRPNTPDSLQNVSPEEEIRRLIVRNSAPGLQLNEEEKNKTKMMSRERDPPGMLRIYTDGSSLRNGQAGARAGIGVFFGPHDPKNVSEALKGSKQTNQRAELTAILRALDIAPRHREVTIYTDSKYAIDCVTNWYHNWKRNGWMNAKGKPVENKDLVVDIRERIEEREELNKPTYFVWVKGHKDNAGNIAADRLAVQGATLGRGIDQNEDAGSGDGDGGGEGDDHQAEGESRGTVGQPERDESDETREAFEAMERAIEEDSDDDFK